jgi:tetratricopeptide (TPR) repeat protein
MDLALVSRRERRFDDAARAYRQALQIYRQKERAGPAAAALSGLASLLSARHQYGGAGDLLEQAIAMLEEGGSPALPQTGQLKAELGDIRAAQKQTAEAVKLYREALGILEPAFGAESPRLLPVLESYAKALRAQQDYAGAASIDFRTMRIRVRQTLGRARHQA